MSHILQNLTPFAGKIPGIKFIYHHSLTLRKIISRRKYNYYKNLNQDKYPQELKKWFKSATGKPLNLENPKTFGEKINWMKLYDSTPLKTQLADKYLVRNYVSEKIGEEYLIPLLGVWSSFDEIDFEKLPNQFVLKANHGSGWNIIVRDKSEFDKNSAKKMFDKWMKTNYAFQAGLELHYKDINPKIIAEKYIENSGGNLSDYKVHCFGGKAIYVQYIGDRATQTTHEAWYDRQWKLMPFTLTYPKYEQDIPCPNNLGNLLRLSENLSSPFSYVRVDFYVLNDGQFKFGELTFTPASGGDTFTPDKYNLEIGELITWTNQRL